MKDKNSSEDATPAIFEYISKYIGQLNEAEMEAILQLANLASYKKGDLIFKQGEIPKKIGFILVGAVRSFYIDEEGKDNTVSFGFENEPIAPYGSFVDQVPSAVSVIALEPVELIWTGQQDYYAFLESFPRFETGIAKLLGEYLVRGGQHLKLMRINSSRERYEKLCELQPELVQRIPLKYIASYLDMALETLSRIRAGKL